MIRLILAWLYIVIYTSGFIIITILTLGLLTPYIWHIACRGWGRGVLKIAGIDLQVINKHYLDQLGPRIIIYNHQSMLDVAWLAGTLAPRGVCVVKREFMYIPFVNLAFYFAGFIFIDRSKREDAIARMKAGIAKIIRLKASLYIAPEGTRSFTDEILPFKKGGFHLALMGKLPIYPVVAHGGHALLPKGHYIARPGKLTLKCLDPLDTSSWTEYNLTAKIKEVRELMQAELVKLARAA